MSKKKNTKNTKNQKKQRSSAANNHQPILGEVRWRDEIGLLFPILFFTTIYLFCVRGRLIDSNVSDQFWFSGGETVGDLFAYFRMQVFLIIMVLFTLYLVFLFLSESLTIIKHRVYIPMAVYIAAVLLSLIFSQHKEIALWGYIERYEGTLVLIFYMLLLFYAFHAVRSERSVKLIMTCFTVACVLLGLWGILQTLGYFIGDLPAWLYLPSDMIGTVDLSRKTHDNAVNLFFTNRNYSSFFMIFPICLSAMACIGQDNRLKKIFYAVLTGIMLYCLWNSASLGGMVALVASFLMAIAIAGPANLMKWKKSLGLLAIAAVISIGTSLPAITLQLNSAGLFSKLPLAEEAYGEEMPPAYTSTVPLVFVEINSVVTDGSSVVFDFDGNEVTIAAENNQLKSVTDSNGNPLSTESGLLNASTTVDATTGATLLQVQTASYLWQFGIVEDELLFCSPSGQGIKLDKTAHIGFEDNERFGSGRGYIWSRTLPLLKDTIFIGQGADTYALTFPQDDYAGKYSHMGNTTIIVDKPHNMYLGSAVNTGIISMLALIAIYGMYLIEAVKIYRRHTYEHYMDYIGMSILIAITGFLVSGLVNDSTVQMMPVVYTFLGIGFAINRMISIRKPEEL